MQVNNGIYQAKYYEWSSVEVLKGVNQEDITASEEYRSEHKSQFWHDMSSEYDARHLAKYMMESGIEFSPGFDDFVHYWARDENNHYEGLRRINYLVYDLNEDETDQEMQARSVDFRPISHLMRDEFEILMAFAFDEITSARAYIKDFDVYPHFGPKAFMTWLKNAQRDEATHGGNALKLLKLHHMDRATDVPAAVKRIMEYELRSDMEYTSTFVFDHDTYQFTEDLLIGVAKTICEYFDQPHEYA